MKSWVYFIQAGPNGPIKIGVATDVYERLAQLQTANHQPLQLLACVRGDQNDEAHLHVRFHDCRLLGEWFACTEGLLALIAEHRLNVPPEPRGPHGIGAKIKCNVCGYDGRRKLPTYGWVTPSCPSCRATACEMNTPRGEP